MKEETQLTTCDECGEYFYWTPGDEVYGNIEEVGDEVKLFCSNRCRVEFNKSK